MALKLMERVKLYLAGTLTSVLTRKINGLCAGTPAPTMMLIVPVLVKHCPAAIQSIAAQLPRTTVPLVKQTNMVIPSIQIVPLAMSSAYLTLE